MIRFYGSDYAADLRSKFEYFVDANNVNPLAYSTRITNVTIDSRYSYLRDNSRDAALMANSHVCSIQGIGHSAINDITAFYEEVDQVSEGIYNDACLYFEILDNLLTTVNNLCELLNSSRQGCSLVTVDAINAACVPLDKADILNRAANLGLINPTDGVLSPEDLEAIRTLLSEMGIENVSDDELRGYWNVVQELRSRGYTDAQIIEMTPSIFEVDYFDQSYAVGSYDSSAQQQAIEGIADAVIRSQLEDLFGDNEYAEEYIDVLLSNSSPEFIAEVIRVCGDPGSLSSADRVDFMIRLGLAGVGYTEEGTNRTVFGAFFPAPNGGTKQGVEWCAMYVTWLLGWSGFLDDSLIPGVTLENATSSYYWAGVSNIRDSFSGNHRYNTRSSGYIPCNGDLVVFSSHIGMVIGVDEENGVFYTVEGNIDGEKVVDGEEIGGRVFVREHRFDESGIDGYCVVEGQQRNMDYASAYVSDAESGFTSTH